MVNTFRISFPIKDPGFKLRYGDPVFALGSCFVHHLAGYLKRLKMPVVINPNGVQYNPVSIGHVISHILNQKSYGETDLAHQNGKYFSIYHDSSFYHCSQKGLLEQINENRENAATGLRDAKLVIITLGTAWVWRSKTGNKIVSNCHKIPQTEFDHGLLSIDDTVSHVSETIALLQHHTAVEHICFTISPVRYWRSDPVKDRLGKSVLHLALAQVLTNQEGLSYFPSYEILEDELRDYRFYASDMAHPSDLAVSYILEKFLDKYCTANCREALDELKALEQRIRHRPLHPDSKEHLIFIQKTATALDTAEKRYGVDLSGWCKELNGLAD